MNFDPALWTALTALLKGVKNVPVLRRSQANRANWMDELESGTLPKVIWVIDVRDSYEEQWAMNAACYRYPITILYLRPANLSAAEITAQTTVEAQIEARIAAVRDALITYSGSDFQLAGKMPTRSISDRNEFNQILMELQNRYFGGGIDAEPLVGEII
jgi:hypothetical protein